VVAFAGCSAAPAPVAKRAGAPRTVVLISLDGMRHDYPIRVAAPTFARLAAEGATADRLIPPYPSQTFPGHATLATGVTAERHGIVNNRFKDRVRGAFNYGEEASWYDAMPLWVYTTRQGLTTYVDQWVGSRGPWQGTEPAEVHHFEKGSDDDDRLDRLLAWLHRPAPPRLVMSYWLGCDKAGHGEGPDTSEVRDCTEATDDRLARLSAGLAALPYPTALVVVADHGMTRTEGSVDLYRAVEALDFAVEVIPSGTVAHLFVAPQRIDATLALVRSLPHLQAWRGDAAPGTPDALPAALHYHHPTRTGDVVVATTWGWHFDGRQGRVIPGHHGHDPEKPEMGAVFYAWGDGIRPGSRAQAPRAVDIMPTLCQLLGLPIPAGLDGRVLSEILLP